MGMMDEVGGREKVMYTRGKARELLDGGIL